MSGQLSKRALKKLKKKIDVEYDSRTDITGHFKSEYDQGFCDGADWFFKLAEKEAVSPSLTDDQQVVLETLKQYYSKPNFYAFREGKEPMQAVDRMLMEAESDATVLSDVYYALTEKQQFQVLAAFAEWGSKEEQS